MISQDASLDEVLAWESIGGATYTLHYSTNLLNGFTVMTNGITPTPPLNVFTNNQEAGASTIFYHLELEAQ